MRAMSRRLRPHRGERQPRAGWSHPGRPAHASLSVGVSPVGAGSFVDARFLASFRACLSSRRWTSLRSRLSFAIVVFLFPLEAISGPPVPEVRARHDVRADSVGRGTHRSHRARAGRKRRRTRARASPSPPRNSEAREPARSRPPGLWDPARRRSSPSRPRPAT